MTVIFDWVKNIVFFYIIMTAILYLLPKNNYQKYVRFFGGMILVVMLITPLLELVYRPDYLLDKISYESFWQEMDEIQLDVTGMEQQQKQAFQKEYEAAIGEDIVQMAEAEEIVVNDVSVQLSEEYELKQVSLNVRLKESSEGIQIEKITLADNSKEYPDVWELKKKIMEFYEVEDSQIQITVQEG